MRTSEENGNIFHVYLEEFLLSFTGSTHINIGTHTHVGKLLKCGTDLHLHGLHRLVILNYNLSHLGKSNESD